MVPGAAQEQGRSGAGGCQPPAQTAGWSTSSLLLRQLQRVTLVAATGALALYLYLRHAQVADRCVCRSDVHESASVGEGAGGEQCLTQGVLDLGQEHKARAGFGRVLRLFQRRHE